MGLAALTPMIKAMGMGALAGAAKQGVRKLLGKKKRQRRRTR